jgi:hypothetical protein
MFPLVLTASPVGEHPADEMPDRVPKLMVCSTWPVVLIWETPPGLFVPDNCGIETQNDAPPFVVVSGFHAVVRHK